MNDITIDATFSAEDNKLRLYADSRLDKALYDRVCNMGFKWAPKQELFVAPKWTPAREDFCIELAGNITAEQTTLVDRAEAKIERLESLATKREQQSNSYHDAAKRISERFASGQPILIGHHSERKARKDQKAMHSAMDAAVKASKSVEYWNYKAEGVEHYANRKSNQRVRVRRIKGLLADLRYYQRAINHAHICLDLWGKIESTEDIQLKEEITRKYAGAQLSTGAATPCFSGESLWSQLKNNSITIEKTIEICLDFHDYQSRNPYTIRWINHILNRLAFEHSELGEVEYFKEDLTATILKSFAREHGAHKPEAKKDAEGKWFLTSAPPLPFHIANGDDNLSLNDKGWRDLMQSLGYEVPARKPTKPAILNFKCDSIRGESWGSIRIFKQIELTKAEYSAIYSDYRGVKVSECGTFRFKICKDLKNKTYSGSWFAVFLTDSKIHSTPVYGSISLQQNEGVEV